MSITFPCPKCKNSITRDMNYCEHCGTELVPIAIQSQPIENPDSYGHYNSNKSKYQPQQGYKEKPKVNKLVIIFFVLFLGLLSAIGYYLIVKNPNSPKRRIFGVFLIIVSIIINISFIYQ